MIGPGSLKIKIRVPRKSKQKATSPRVMKSKLMSLTKSIMTRGASKKRLSS